jgi:hypothetical protein
LIEEYDNKNSHRLDNKEEQLLICYDEKSPCVPTSLSNDNSNTKMIIDAINCNSESRKGENCHSKKLKGESDNEKLTLKLKSKMKDELEKSHREQLILLKENKQEIINFLVDNKDSIKIEDWKIYESVYKCNREKGNCQVCNGSTNIIWKNYNTYNNNELWLCTNHWQQHAIENH